MKHTPAPWTFTEFQADWRDKPSCFIHQADNAPFTGNYSDVAETVRNENIEIQRANARLIAAAPELLEALQAAVDCGMVPVSSVKDGGASKYSIHVRVADQIRKVIAKATGES